MLPRTNYGLSRGEVLSRLREVHTARRRLKDRPAAGVLGTSVSNAALARTLPVHDMSFWSGEIAVEYYDLKLFRIVAAKVDQQLYNQLWNQGLLKHQWQKLPKPEHLPEPAGIAA